MRDPAGQGHALSRPARTDPDEGLVEEPLGLEPARDLLPGDHRAVHLAEPHQADAFARVGGGDLEAQRHPLVQEVAEHRHQQGSAEIVADRDAQGCGRAAGQLAEVGEERLRLGAELQDAGQGCLARRGETDAAAGALEEGHAQVALELADLLADRGGGAMVQPGRRADRAAARDGEQGQEGREEGGIDH